MCSKRIQSLYNDSTDKKDKVSKNGMHDTHFAIDQVWSGLSGCVSLQVKSVRKRTKIEDKTMKWEGRTKSGKWDNTGLFWG